MSTSTNTARAPESTSSAAAEQRRYLPGDRVIYSGPRPEYHGEMKVADPAYNEAGRVWLIAPAHGPRGRFNTDPANVRPMFKVGDKVRYVGPSPLTRGTQGRIVRIDHEGSLRVRLPSGQEVMYLQRNAELIQEEPRRDPKDFRVGDKVRIVRKVTAAAGWDNEWTDEMDAYVGKSATIERMGGPLGISLDGFPYHWPPAALELVDTAVTQPEDVPAAAAPVDLDKPLFTRCGYKALRLVGSEHVDSEGLPCFAARVEKPGRAVKVHTYYLTGRYLSSGKDHALDLTNEKPGDKPAVREVLANLYAAPAAGAQQYSLCPDDSLGALRWYKNNNGHPKVATLRLRFTGDDLTGVDVVADKGGKIIGVGA